MKTQPTPVGSIEARIVELTCYIHTANEVNARLKGQLEFAIEEYLREKETRRELQRQNAALLAACKELRSYADLKLQGHRQDYPENHCMVQTALRMIALADSAIALAQEGK